jgi:hypothetical protein
VRKKFLVITEASVTAVHYILNLSFMFSIFLRVPSVSMLFYFIMEHILQDLYLVRL